MAVKNNQECKIVLKVQTGVSSSGKAAYGQRTISYINPAVTDDDVLDIGTKLAGLQAHPLSSIKRQDVAEIAQA